MKAVPLLAFLASGALAGCMIGDVNAPGPGSGSNPNPGSPDGSPSGGNTPDAAPAQATCDVGMDLGSLGTLATPTAVQGNVAGSQGALHWYKIDAAIPGTTSSYVSLYLVDGQGAFQGGKVAPGTYTIGTADANIATCGACALVLGNVDPTTKLADQVYLAQSGTITVTSVGTGGGTLSASFSNAALSHVDMTSQAVAADGCKTNVSTASMSGTVVVQGGNGMGGGGGTGPGGA